LVEILTAQTTGDKLKKLFASDSMTNDEFGISVGLNGDVAIVGAHYQDSNGTNSGAVYVFENFVSLVPEIGTNSLIFPAADSVIYAMTQTNITWNIEQISDNKDGTNLTVSKISLHYADNTNFILEITNSIENTIGEIKWDVPSGSWTGETNYVLKFEVIDSDNYTNTMIFYNNVFVLVPEPFYVSFIVCYLLFIIRGSVIK
jgi:hypothetical protein